MRLSASIALFALPLAGCGGASGSDGGAPDASGDQSAPIDAAVFDGSAPLDLAGVDGLLCLASVPKTHLTEEICQEPGPSLLDCLAGPGDPIIADGY